MNVLIVEDDAVAARAISRSIVGWNHSAETAGTGREAMAKIRRKRFDLVLLDIFLPDCRGNELIPQLKETWPHMGIVTMTGYNSRKLELQVRQQGVLFYMIKPFNGKVIKEVLDHISGHAEKEG